MKTGCHNIYVQTTFHDWLNIGIIFGALRQNNIVNGNGIYKPNDFDPWI